MRWLVIAMVLGACARERSPVATRAEPARPAPVVASVEPDRRAATRLAAHDALAEHCGSCHEAHQPTAKPAALAVFDLDRPDWPTRFDDHRFASALGRLASKPAAARDAFVAFRDAEVAAR